MDSLYNAFEHQNAAETCTRQKRARICPKDGLNASYI